MDNIYKLSIKGQHMSSIFRVVCVLDVDTGRRKITNQKLAVNMGKSLQYSKEIDGR